MLVIVCGEDSASSRNYFIELQKKYRDKGYFLQNAETGQLQDILKEDEGAYSLFDQKKVYVFNNLTRAINRKTGADTREKIKKLAEDPNTILLDWESGKTAREITLKEAQVKEFKLPENVFKLLEVCYPGNLAAFISQFTSLCEHVEPEFVFAMLARHVRLLLLASQDALPASVPSWQRAKLKGQAAKWTGQGLLAFYESLARIDRNTKTSRDALGMKKAIDIAASFCLR